MKRCTRFARLGAALLGVCAVPALVWAEDFTGRLDWVQRVTLSTLVSGTVSEIPAKPGDRVDQGAALLRLDARGFEAAVRRAEARVASLGEKRDEAQRELERAQELYDRTVLSDRDLQLASIAAAEAEADYRAAEAALVQAKLDLEYSVVRAPFAGLVLDVPARLGQTVVTTTQVEPLVVVASAGSMLARIEVPPSALAGIEEGQAARVAVGTKVYPGRVVRLGLEPAGGGADPRYPVDVVFESGGDLLRAGSTARVGW